jgi:hypothetical protein
MARAELPAARIRVGEHGSPTSTHTESANEKLAVLMNGFRTDQEPLQTIVLIHTPF